LDLKTGKGLVGKGDAPNSADATLTMHSKDFADLFAGNLCLFQKRIQNLTSEIDYVVG